MTTDRVWSFPPGGVLAVQRARRAVARRRKRRASVWRRAWLLARPRPARASLPASSVEIVIASLHALCAFRTRLELGRIRARLREDAVRQIKTAPRDDDGATTRAALPAEVTNDEASIRRLRPSLEQLQRRLRTAARSLERFCGELTAEHDRLAKASVEGWSRAPQTAALARLLAARCDILNAQVAFFVSHMQGPAGAAPVGHRGAVDAKAWHRLRGETKLRLAQAGAGAAKLGVVLFPDSFEPVRDPDAARMQNDRERKEIRRAKRRRATNT
jgi:hypothetical protein